jgi:hypothetical protein
MDWVGAEAAHGEWIRARLQMPFANMHQFVPHGFEAYARIFHPLDRDRPVGDGSWLDVPELEPIELDSESTTWTVLAETFGRTMHPLAQFRQLVERRFQRLGEFGETLWTGPVIDADGWRYDEPHEGDLGIGTLATLARILSAHTATPDVGVVAVWDGYNEIDVHAEGAGRFELPWRSYGIYASGIRTFIPHTWIMDAPWTKDTVFPRTPNIIWPEDHAWIVASEIDLDSTVVGGSRALVDAIIASPDLEAFEIPEGADLTSLGDRINPRPSPTPPSA